MFEIYLMFFNLFYLFVGCRISLLSNISAIYIPDKNSMCAKKVCGGDRFVIVICEIV
jgi:hypothetical protein